MDAKQLAEALRLCTPYTPKAVELYRQHLWTNGIIPGPPPRTVQTTHAIVELLELGKASQKLSEQLLKLPPVVNSSEHDQDLFVC